MKVILKNQCYITYPVNANLRATALIDLKGFIFLVVYNIFSLYKQLFKNIVGNTSDKIK